MSLPDINAIVDMRIDFVVTNTSKDTLECHYNDGWGPTDSPHGQEGLQDCLLDRIQLCARHGHGQHKSSDPNAWFDFSKCIFRNWEATDTITDGMKAFNETVEYCSALSGQDAKALKECAESSTGLELLTQSHAIEQKLNTHHDAQGNNLPVWVIIDGVDHSTTTSDKWLGLVCDAYKGTKPKSCP